MDLILYTNASDEKVVSKKLTKIKDVSVTLKNDCNVLEPSFYLQYVGEDIFTCNYCYCPAFKRYYYITTIDVITGGRVVLSCKCDVLMTYKSEILKSTQYVTRQENKKTDYLVDDKYNVLTSKTVKTIEFSNSDLNLREANGESYNFVVAVAGGAIAGESE